MHQNTKARIEYHKIWILYVFRKVGGWGLYWNAFCHKEQASCVVTVVFLCNCIQDDLLTIIHYGLNFRKKHLWHTIHYGCWCSSLNWGQKRKTCSRALFHPMTYYNKSCHFRILCHMEQWQTTTKSWLQ